MARNTFKAVFGSEIQPFFGGGVDVVVKDRYFVDATVTRFSKKGERAFRLNGQTFKLGVPLRATETPIEFTAGYRFRKRAHVVPYVGAGLGSYQYTERSDFADPGEDVDTSHVGFIAKGGIEGLIHRNWLRLAADVQYTRVTGILGTGGISAAAVSGDKREQDLGGIAARFRVIVGK